MASKFYNLLESMIDQINRSAKSINGFTPNAAGEVTIKEPVNLLDNSDFRDPVNQQGLTEYTNTGGNVQTIDRWKINSENGNVVFTVVKNTGVTCMVDNSGVSFCQVVSASEIIKSKVYTFAVMAQALGEYHIICASGRLSDGSISFNSDYGRIMLTYDSSTDSYIANISGTAAYVWAALYEGEYTEDTLPEYKPKDRLAELAECYRYYRVFNFTNYIGAGLSTSEIYFNVDLGGIPMRSQPTVTMSTLPTTVYVEGATGSWVIDESTVALQNYTDGDTVLGVYSKSTKTATYVNKRATRVDQIGFIFDARP